MTNRFNTANHPGAYVRAQVIPAGMSVTEAARRLDVGRPALSNFLNGKSSLSHEMAVRLEKAFGANREKLLNLQAVHDQQERRADDSKVAVIASVPPFLTIKANQIEKWAGEINARTHLAVLLRKLIHSTGSDLRRVDFPGYDNAERKGSDGFVEADAATPWVPEGKSYWEFGVNQNPRTKAEDDYATRLQSVDPAERKDGTFVFVTPRNWPGKTDWEREKKNAGDWKTIRVFDASDLEQWLEQSPSTQIWFSGQINQPADGCESLEYAWRRWADACTPPLTCEMFTSSITAYRDKIKAWLDKPSRNGPFTIAADSRDEALAFLHCVFNDSELCNYRDRAVIFTSPEALKKLVTFPIPLIPIVYSRDIEQGLAHVYGRFPCIALRPRNAAEMKPDVELDLLGHNSFREALSAMGIERDDEVRRLARESGYSPTILRRRLALDNSVIRIPEWASDDDTATRLIPIALIGAWCRGAQADKEILSCLANRQYDEIESDITSLLRLNDPPVWSVGNYYGVASKIDALFAIAGIITSTYVDRFFSVAKTILSESDPALELPEEDRWAAAMHGKNRRYSDALREGVLETLVILSVHGNDLFQGHLGVDVEDRVEKLIRNLLTPLTLDGLLSQSNNLPGYAEAAPDTFLNIIEDDLRQSNPVVPDLLKPVDSSIFGASPWRTNLLWALECLAWDSKWLSRVVLILARLSQQSINDNWLNTPFRSLEAVFRSWMPQTAASVDRRIEVLELLIKNFPDIAWTICIAQVQPGPRTGDYSNKPRWRRDATGAGQPVARKELYDFNRKALDFLIAWPSHNEKTLGDLVEILRGVPDEGRNEVWKLIGDWSQQADDMAKVSLRERIRQFALTRRSLNRGVEESIRTRSRKAYDSMQPRNLVARHSWLFARRWVDLSIDEIDARDRNDRGRYDQKRVSRLRQEAMAEIWTELGFKGVLDLLAKDCDPLIIGEFMAPLIADVEIQKNFIQYCLNLDDNLQNRAERCLQGFLFELGDKCLEALRTVAEKLPVKKRIRLLICAPFRASTWRLVSGYNEDVRAGYWRTVDPSRSGFILGEITELIDRLLDAGRARVAFCTVQNHFEDVETSRLKRLLHNIVRDDDGPEDYFKIDPYYISLALTSLGNRSGVTPDEMANLEFTFFHALEYSEHGIPNLQNQFIQSPALFVQAIVFLYKRSDAGEDPPEWRVDDPERQQTLASTVYGLLNRIEKIPGTDEDGSVDIEKLTSWLSEVRRLCRQVARRDIGDYWLGQLLARAPKNEDGTWPCEPVCEVLESIESSHVKEGFEISVYNMRGTVCRSMGEGGEQERELAEQYRSWATCLRSRYPFVGTILDGIAESYERDACREDIDVNVRQRLHP